MRTFTERELTSSDEGDIVGLIVLTCRLARNSDELVSMLVTRPEFRPLTEIGLPISVNHVIGSQRGGSVTNGSPF